ncbi:DNA alkylation repair protein [Pelagicoccus sp. NFK12]|uniref:DNA alkylation repair protein n=1 Tax=Pelagicoccus enzymogenes TaxID=2773457 RepID=A0A927FAF9_9BACT|nr:DNA alkylation repair protein [Pelagicoccus enzymogenes]MBD5781284.1 DNA alkylation repair protein [Pelagicoccus enzymogenes]
MEPFKNFIDAKVVRTLSQLVKAAYPEFDDKRFQKRCLAKLDALELKQRAALLAEELWRELPDDPSQAFEVARQAILPVPLLEEDDSFDGWLFMAFNSLLTAHGLEAPDAALKLVPEVTQRFTAEFGIRVFLIHKPEKVFPLLQRWAMDSNHNLRRLVSEGTRPRLPWGEQITAFVQDPRPVLPLLELLKDDPSEYVRRSVANNLNDISKDNPQLMLDTVEAWLADASPQRQRLLKHACRSLVKQGHPRCLKLLGYQAPKLKVAGFSASPRSLKLGEKLVLQLELQSTAPQTQQLIVDYRFHFVKANGQTSPKVFKGATLTLAPKAKRSLQKSFHLKPITTRKYYTGENTVDLLVNGKPLASIPFHLSVS